MDLFLVFEEASMRLMCGRNLVMTELKHSVSGKWSAEKQNELKKSWVRSIATKYSELAGIANDQKMDIKESEVVLGLLKNCCVVRIPCVCACI